MPHRELGWNGLSIFRASRMLSRFYGPGTEMVKMVASGVGLHSAAQVYRYIVIASTIRPHASKAVLSKFRTPTMFRHRE